MMMVRMTRKCRDTQGNTQKGSKRVEDMGIKIPVSSNFWVAELCIARCIFSCEKGRSMLKLIVVALFLICPKREKPIPTKQQLSSSF